MTYFASDFFCAPFFLFFPVPIWKKNYLTVGALHAVGRIESPREALYLGGLRLMISFTFVNKRASRCRIAVPQVKAMAEKCWNPYGNALLQQTPLGRHISSTWRAVRRRGLQERQRRTLAEGWKQELRALEERLKVSDVDNSTRCMCPLVRVRTTLQDYPG